VISVVQLGQVDYATGLRLQQKLLELRKAGQIGDVLLLLEHAPVITLGRNAKAANVLASTEELARRGVELFECDRGGDVTFHGPGQLVGYPILDLRGFGGGSQPSAVSHPPEPSTSAKASSPGKRKTLGAVDYVRRLEEALIRTCADFRIPAKRIAKLTGVWTDRVGTGVPARPSGAQLRSDPLNNTSRTPEAKIAAIGVHISRSVTSHGFALNVNTDLTYFDLIVPCGIESKPVTSMQKELGREVDLHDVAESISRNFGSVFARQIRWVNTLDALLGNTMGIPMKAPDELRGLHQEDDVFLA
jgi:lipoyl(octanoyl) transferase